MKNPHVIFIAMSILLSACTTIQPNKMNGQDISQYTDQHSFCPKVTRAKLAACTTVDGMMQKQGKSQCYTCTISYTDTGKTCSGTVDCQGKCYNQGTPVPLNVPNQTGQCARDNIMFGCRQTIENGMATNGMLCID